MAGVLFGGAIGAAATAGQVEAKRSAVGGDKTFFDVVHAALLLVSEDRYRTRFRDPSTYTLKEVDGVDRIVVTGHFDSADSKNVPFIVMIDEPEGRRAVCSIYVDDKLRFSR